MAFTHSIPWSVWDHGDAPESFEPFERIDQPYSQWQLAIAPGRQTMWSAIALHGAGTGTPTGAALAYFNLNPDVANAYRAEDYGLSANDFALTHWERFGKNERRVSPNVLGMLMNARTPQAVADAYRVWSAENGNNEATFVAAALPLGITQSMAIEARNILLNRPPGTAWDGTPPATTPTPTATGYPQAEVNRALSEVLAADPSALYTEVLRHAIAIGVTEAQLLEAYRALGKIPNRGAPVAPPPVAPPPAAADATASRSSDWLPPGWARNQAGTVVPPPAISTPITGFVQQPRDIEPGGGMGPMVMPPGMPDDSGVVESRASVPLPILAAGAAVAAFLLTRK